MLLIMKMIWDPIECAHSIYQDFFLVWPDDGPTAAETVAYYLIY